MASRLPSRERDRGQALPLVIGVIAVLAVLLLAVGWFGRSMVDAARACTAADAAALAGAAEGAAAARSAAADNGGELVVFEQLGADVRVTVRVGRATAVARATAGSAAVSPVVLPTLIGHGSVRPPG